jgi:DHA1 family inner membrane transport protein
MVLFALTAESKVLTVLSLLLMGAFGFATVPALQMRVMTYAGSATTLASGANIAAFNLGNAFGAWLGGLTIAAGLGYVSPIWVGAALTATALAVLLVAEPRTRAAAPTEAKAHDSAPHSWAEPPSSRSWSHPERVTPTPRRPATLGRATRLAS